MTAPTTSTLDMTLRPHEWDDYVGQTKIKENIKILLQAADERGQAAEHMLFYGPPGLGKTSLAYLIAHKTGRNIKTTSGPAIEKVGDLASILTNLMPGDILFVDEIHRLNKTIEEVLYPAMESGVLDIIIGKGPSARTLQLELPPFTLVGATTRIGLLSSPLRSRFSGGVYRLEMYSVEELADILTRSAQLLEVAIERDSLIEIAARSRSTPRTANYLLKRVRDFAQVYEKDIRPNIVCDALELLGIDDRGLSQLDRDYLDALDKKFGGGPTGLKTLAAALNEDEGTLEDVIEPYLIQQGYIEKTARGRIMR